MDWNRPDLQELVDLNRLDPVNKIHLDKYLRHLKVKNLKPSSIKSKIERLCLFLKYYRYKDLNSLTKEELEDYIIFRRDSGISAYTIHGERLELKIFYKWFMPEKVDLLFDKWKKPKTELPLDQLLTREEIARMVKMAGNPRDRALLMMLWDSACRINEILSRNVGQIEFDKYGAVVIVNGKTGQRRIRLIDAVPDLQAWVNIHPMRENPTAPLFITYTKYGFGQKRLSLRAVENGIKVIADRAGIPRERVYPHAIRHARLTDLAKQGYNEMKLRLMAGWADNSQMASVYVHISGGDIEKEQLQRAGLLDEVQHEETTLKQKKCPRCKVINSPDAKYCISCSLTLSREAADTQETIRQLVEENEDALIEFLMEKRAKKAAGKV